MVCIFFAAVSDGNPSVDRPVDGGEITQIIGDPNTGGVGAGVRTDNDQLAFDGLIGRDGVDIPTADQQVSLSASYMARVLGHHIPFDVRITQPIVARIRREESPTTAVVGLPIAPSLDIMQIVDVFVQIAYHLHASGIRIRILAIPDYLAGGCGIQTRARAA